MFVINAYFVMYITNFYMSSPCEAMIAAAGPINAQYRVTTAVSE